MSPKYLSIILLYLAFRVRLSCRLKRSSVNSEFKFENISKSQMTMLVAHDYDNNNNSTWMGRLQSELEHWFDSEIHPVGHEMSDNFLFIDMIIMIMIWWSWTSCWWRWSWRQRIMKNMMLPRVAPLVWFVKSCRAQSWRDLCCPPPIKISKYWILNISTI